MKSKTAKIMYLFLLCNALFVILADYCINSSEFRRIALLPFRINAQKDLSDFANGIFDMFTTRLTNEGQVPVLSRDQAEGAKQAEASSVFSAQARITDLVLRYFQSELLVDLRVAGFFTEEMQAAVLKGMPVNISFSISFYEVIDFWFDHKMIEKKEFHSIHYDALRKEYKIRRSTEKRISLVIKDFKKAQSLFSTIKGIKVIPLKKLKKGKHYQLRVKSEFNNKVHFANFPSASITDWYTINFIY